MIDLRSDTVTKPSIEMIKAMSAAEVGDDVYGEDKTVNELQEYTADLLGKEAALFAPSGTMTNQIAINIMTKSGDELIAEADAHIYYYETAAPSILSRVQIRPIPSLNGEIPLDIAEDTVRPDVYYFPNTTLFCLENTHNRHGGTVLSLDYINQAREFASKYHLGLHCDGARLWNACISKNIDPKTYARHFDTLSVCLSKGLGAPVGSLIVSSKENIKKALKVRKIFGGGMRQAGILAAAGLFALKNNFEKLALDHENAQFFAKSINESDKASVDLSRLETNIVMINIDKSIDAEKLVQECKNSGLLLSAVAKYRLRAVFHLDITKPEAQKAADIFKTALMRV